MFRRRLLYQLRLVSLLTLSLFLGSIASDWVGSHLGQEQPLPVELSPTTSAPNGELAIK